MQSAAYNPYMDVVDVGDQQDHVDITGEYDYNIILYLTIHRTETKSFFKAASKRLTESRRGKLKIQQGNIGK